MDKLAMVKQTQENLYALRKDLLWQGNFSEWTAMLDALARLEGKLTEEVK